ncbi:MAG TPA: hypothetical protein VNE58_15705 [Casimicrobiaceae bacterium]|nr:hypothetical protein [Casimicrobiaceae bacterium]
MRRLACALLVPAGALQMAVAGPVETYREGARYCPRDRSAHAPVLSETAIVERARALLPDRFCGPARFVAGCDAQTEFIEGTWRVYLHQYQLRAGRHDWGGLTHTYVILDPVGNCVAHFAGTEPGSRE